MSVKQYSSVRDVRLAKKDKDLSIIIVNYNLAEEIENCLNSLLKVIEPLNQVDYEVIIVDNNSSDRSIVEIKKKFVQSNIHFYYLERNLGFGKGCNYGFSKASGKYICFLNPDIIVEEDIFSPIIALFEYDKTVGIIGPKQQVRSPFFDFSAGFFPNLFFEMFNLFVVGVLFEGLLVFTYAKLSRKKILKVHWILGASIFIRSKLFKSINGFDKEYFMFFEEVDLCKRVYDKGLKVVYYPKLKIHHIGSVSGKKDYRLYTVRTYSSKYLYITKHYKSLYRFLMKFLLFVQLFSQLFIWTVLMPVNKQKSIQKLKAFVYLLKNRMKNNLD